MPDKNLAAARSDEKPGLDASGLEKLLGYKLGQAHIVVYRDFMASLSELGITARLHVVMLLVRDNPKLSQAAIADLLRMDRATTMMIVDRLERQDLIMRQRSRQDRRRQELILTSEGQKTLKKAEKIISRHEQKLEKLF